MPAFTVGNLSDETHRALKARAARNGCSMAAEIRAILDEAVRPEGRVKVGSALAALRVCFGGIELDLARDPAPGDGVHY